MSNWVFELRKVVPGRDLWLYRWGIGIVFGGFLLGIGYDTRRYIARIDEQNR